MDHTHQALEKSRPSAGDISESHRPTASDQPLAKDTIPELLPPIAADASAPELSSSSPNQISRELCRLHQACWAVLREPLHAAMTFRLALCAIETVCHLEGGNAAYLLTLAVAQYRLGQYEAALATLAEADKIIPNTPTSLAFQAMAHFQLGGIAQAHSLLARLQQVIQQPPWHKNPEADGFLREARTLIEAVKSGK
jgi:tetratricopeptide (TPR) repeat protein